MAQRSQFFDSVGGDRIYTSEAWAQVLRAIAGDGVVGTGLAVTEDSPPDMSVLVNVGKAWVQGRFFEVYSAAHSLTIPAAHSTLPRIDRIVVRLDYAGRAISLGVKQGVAAAIPAAPSLQQDNSLYEITLARIAVGVGVTSIGTASITDERVASDLAFATSHERSTSNPHATTAVQVGAVSNLVAADGSVTVSVKNGAGVQTIAANAAVGAQVNVIENVELGGHAVGTGTVRTVAGKTITLHFYVATQATHGLMAAADKLKLDMTSPSNVANYIMQRNGDGDVAARQFIGNLAGTATAANSATTAGYANSAGSAPTLSAGADRTKLDRIGSTTAAFLGSNQTINGGTAVIYLALPAGTWLVEGTASFGHPSSAIEGACFLVLAGGAAFVQTPFTTEFHTSGGDRYASLRPAGIVASDGSGQVGLLCWSNTSNCIVRATGKFNNVGYVTGLNAARIA